MNNLFFYKWKYSNLFEYLTIPCIFIFLSTLNEALKGYCLIEYANCFFLYKKYCYFLTLFLFLLYNKFISSVYFLNKIWTTFFFYKRKYSNLLKYLTSPYIFIFLSTLNEALKGYYLIDYANCLFLIILFF